MFGAVLCIQSLSLFAQQTTFSEVFYDSIYGYCSAYSIVPANDNGYIIAGGRNYSWGLLFKVDTSGNMQWCKQYGLTGQAVFTQIISTIDSSFIVVGEMDGIANKSILCMKVNSNGDTLWTKVFGTAINQRALTVEQTFDHGFIITGNVNYTPNFFVAKLDSAGDLEWMNVLNGVGYSNIASSVRQTPDSGYIVTGYVQDYPSYDENTFILKLTPGGAVSWSNKYSFSPHVNCFGSDIIVTNDGIICYLNLDNYIGIGHPDIEIMKIDFNGNILWSKGYPSFRNDPDKLIEASPKIHKTRDNNYAFVTGSFVTASSLIKIDTSGNVIMAKNLEVNAFDLIETNGNGYIIIGDGPLEAEKFQSAEIGIIKIDPMGNAPQCVTPNTYHVMYTNTLISSTAVLTSIMGGALTPVHPAIDSTGLWHYQGCVATCGGIKENNFSKNISVFPVPASDMITIENLTSAKDEIISIYNIQGQLLLQQSMRQSKTQINISSFDKGVYFVRVLGADINVVKKIIKE